ncbi:MAG: tripartite tricarboxylate transporter substrate binding protein [Rhodospirillaceae bacterium]
MKKATAAVLACVACVSAAYGQTVPDFPQRPLRLITGFLPGGVSDTIARVVGEKLGERLGQRVVVDGRPGAGGVLSMELAASANPDGHTLYLGQPVITISPNFKRKPPFDPITAFAPVSQIGTGPTMLTVHPGLPVSSVKELIAHARTQSGGLRYGSSGPGTTNHFSGELLRVMAGMPLTHVPYRGAANVVVAAIQGEIHIAFLPLLAAIPHVKANRLKGLAVTSAKRSKAVPDLPTVAETIPGYAVEAWYGIVVPAKTPTAIVQKLNGTLAQVLAAPEVRERLAGQGVEVDHLGPAPFADMIRKDAARWAKLVKEGGITLE